MASFVTPQNGDAALAEHVAQLTENFAGLRNIPIGLTGINDASAYALTVKNAGTGSKDVVCYAADGTTILFKVDGSGVTASRVGGAAERVLTTGETGSITPTMMASSMGNFGAFTGWTPTLSQSGALTLSAAAGAYTQIGKLVVASFNLTINSAGSAGNNFQLGGLPVASQARGIAGSAYYNDVSVGVWTLIGVWITGSTVEFYSGNGGPTRFGSTPSFAAAAGDTLAGTLVYEVP